jgi:hypothetical protein
VQILVIALPVFAILEASPRFAKVAMWARIFRTVLPLFATGIYVPFGAFETLAKLILEVSLVTVGGWTFESCA